MVALRLDRRLQGRVDPSDVIQEAYLEATRRLPSTPRAGSDAALPLAAVSHRPGSPDAARRHLGAQARDAGREVSIDGGRIPQATSAVLAAQLLGHDTRASEAAIRAERKRRLQEALNAMDPIDREVLVLRHFEQLTNAECARVLGLSESAATKRYIRALRRLKEILTGLPGVLRSPGNEHERDPRREGSRAQSTNPIRPPPSSGRDPLGPVLESFLARSATGSGRR